MEEGRDAAGKLRIIGSRNEPARQAT
jgi:hypothetical protein